MLQFPEFEGKDAHELMIARLDNEKFVRQELEKQRRELLAKKQALIAENKRRKDDLASLDEQLKKFSECIFSSPNRRKSLRRVQLKFVFR